MSKHPWQGTPYSFRYTAWCRTVHSIPVAQNTWIEAGGDPEIGCYEWIIRQDKTVLKHSDKGYGDPAIALRDGLNEYYHELTI